MSVRTTADNLSPASLVPYAFGLVIVVGFLCVDKAFPGGVVL